MLRRRTRECWRVRKSEGMGREGKFSESNRNYLVDGWRLNVSLTYAKGSPKDPSVNETTGKPISWDKVEVQVVCWSWNHCAWVYSHSKLYSLLYAVVLCCLRLDCGRTWGIFIIMRRLPLEFPIQLAGDLIDPYSQSVNHTHAHLHTLLYTHTHNQTHTHAPG